MHRLFKFSTRIKQRLAAYTGLTVMVVGSVATLPAPIAHAATPVPSTPLVSFTFDDGLVSSLTKAMPALAASGLTGTNYVITDCVGKAAPTDRNGDNGCLADGTKAYMTWEQIAQLQAAGWEIGSHTASHPYLASTDPDTQPTPLTSQQVHDELVNSQQVLASHGITAADLAFPYGDYNASVLAEAVKYYESTRGFADTDVMNSPLANATLLADQQVQAGAPALEWSLCKDMTVSGVESCIDQAITNNKWLILVFHDISDTPKTTADDYDYKTSDLAAIAAYVKQKQDAGLIKAVNVRDGQMRGTNLLSNGDFAAGLTGWTTDGTATITADSGNNGRYPEPSHAVSLQSTATATGDSHLYSQQVAVTYGQTYVLKNYVRLLSGGSINFYIDEYDAAGTKLAGVDPSAGLAYDPDPRRVNLADVNFTYTPSSASVASASLQVIIKGANVSAYYDSAEWFAFGTAAPVLVAGDVNGDGLVNLTDLSLLSANWNITTGATRAQGDLNGDGAVNLTDLSLLSANWSK